MVGIEHMEPMMWRHFKRILEDDKRMRAGDTAAGLPAPVSTCRGNRGPAAASLRVVVILAALCVSAGCAAHAAAPREVGMVQVHPTQTSAVLVNPGTGWQLLVNAPPAGEMERMPLVSTYYYRTSWIEFEPEKGRYEDSPAVRVIDAWLAEARKHGRFVAIRVVPWSSRNPRYQRSVAQKVQGCDSPVPPYVFAEGADGFAEPGGSGGWVPVFWDPVYLKYHRKLVEFLGKRYGGDPNIAYIDVPAGNYGEMNLTNTGVPQLDDLSLWKEHGLTASSWSGMLRDLCDMYRGAFPNDLLVAARDYTAYPGGMDAVPYAVAKGVGFRDDGLGMDYCGPGRTNPEYEDNWQSVLCLYENGGGTWLGWGGEARVRAILEWAIDRTHASIVMVGKGKPGARCYAQYSSLVETYGRRLGYRLAVKTATWPAPALRGTRADVTLAWQNLGNAPPYLDFALEVALLAADGTVARRETVTAQTRKWLPGGEYSTRVPVDLPQALTPGSYTVAVSLFEKSADGGVRRRIRLAMDGEKDGRYMLGTLRVE